MVQSLAGGARPSYREVNSLRVGAFQQRLFRAIIQGSADLLAEQAQLGNQKLGKKSHPHGGIAQLGERLHGMQEVIGSIPFTSTIECAVGAAKLMSFFRSR